MELLTKEIREKFKKVGSQEKVPVEEQICIVKFFGPTGSWTWYATEFDGKDTFFGYVRGDENEFGYFSLSELESIKRPFGLGIERDLHFGKHMLAEAMKERL